MEILLGGISALFYGVADFLGGEGAKRAPAASVVLWAGVISFPLLTALALMVGGEPVLGDFILGALAGVFGAFGLVALFAGLGRGRAAAVAPVSAALAAVIPVLVGVIDGERPSSLAWAGIAVGIPAIMLCSSVADTGGVKAGGLFYGVAAGVGFGTFTALIRFTAPSRTFFLSSPRAAPPCCSSSVLGYLGYGRWSGSVRCRRASLPPTASSM